MNPPIGNSSNGFLGVYTLGASISSPSPSLSHSAARGASSRATLLRAAINEYLLSPNSNLTSLLACIYTHTHTPTRIRVQSSSLHSHRFTRRRTAAAFDFPRIHTVHTQTPVQREGRRLCVPLKLPEPSARARTRKLLNRFNYLAATAVASAAFFFSLRSSCAKRFPGLSLRCSEDLILFSFFSLFHSRVILFALALHLTNSLVRRFSLSLSLLAQSYSPEIRSFELFFRREVGLFGGKRASSRLDFTSAARRS